MTDEIKRLLAEVNVKCTNADAELGHLRAEVEQLKADIAAFAATP